jgi:beta-lactamase superfamily II metal-dependent hydrolase
MIDIYNLGQSNGLTDPLKYYIDHYGNHTLFRFILTHPDMDHMSGLDELCRKISIANFWDTDNNKTIPDRDWEGSIYRKEDWDRYQMLRKSNQDPKHLVLYQKATSECCWIEDGITILSPTHNLVKLAKETEDYNYLSYVLRIVYKGVAILLGGDATTEAWDQIAENCGKDFLKADVFLAPHHGSKDNVNEKVFKVIAPDYVVVSVAEGVDYDHQYYFSLARRDVYPTKKYGTIELDIFDNGTYSFK